MPHQRFQRFGFFLNRVISVIFLELREATLTISVSTVDPVSMESEIVGVVSLCTMEISQITRLEIRFSGSEYLKSVFHRYPGKHQNY